MSSNEERITGKVAGLLTRRELLINRGGADGVQIGMRFAVLNSQGINVKDPDTGESLGSAEIVKTVVKIVRIDGEHLSVGRTFRTIAGRPGALTAGSFRSVWAGTPDRVETLDTSGASLKEELSPEDSYIKVGDPVVQSKGDEYDDL